jgi:hypothetical protein
MIGGLPAENSERLMLAIKADADTVQYGATPPFFVVFVVQSHLSEVGQNDVSIDSRPKGRFSCVSNSPTSSLRTCLSGGDPLPSWKLDNGGAKSEGDHNMEKEKTISLEKGDVESDAAIRYDYHPGGEFGMEYQEEYINVFRGNKHILVTRYFDEGDPEPKYCITEVDLKTGEQRLYTSKFKVATKPKKHWIKTMKLEKQALLEANEPF